MGVFFENQYKLQKGVQMPALPSSYLISMSTPISISISNRIPFQVPLGIRSLLSLSLNLLLFYS